MTSSSSSSSSGLLAAAGRDAHGGSPRRRLQKLAAVPGNVPGRENDLLLLRPLAAEPSRTGAEEDQEDREDREGQEGRDRHVVFFHGDIQNFQEEMAAQPDGAQWLSWSLEQVALQLGQRFPGRHVWVVRASRMYLHKFSCYQNFVESNVLGAPEHRPYCAQGGALAHLRALLSHGMERAQLPRPLRPQGGVPPGFSLALVGFSKGCVVLNQAVYELAGARADPQMAPFVERLSDLFWLDGGHPGGAETWVTDERALRELAASGAAVHAHVTPYEVRDPMRAWVGREHARFIRTLEELGARPDAKLHFQDQPPSIENHFRVIREF